jgi:hypothetical protein
LDAEDLQFLSYGRSSFFTVLFFMLKISRIRHVRITNILHNKSNKIGFVFF